MPLHEPPRFTFRDLLLAGTILTGGLGGLWYAAQIAKQVAVNTARLDLLEREGSPALRAMGVRIEDIGKKVDEVDAMVRRHVERWQEPPKP